MKIQSFRLITNLLLVGVAGSGFCGEIHFVSSVELGTPQPTQPASPFTAIGVDDANGKSYTASLELKKIPGSFPPSITGSISANASWTPVARFTVKWVPTFPGEARPDTLVGEWTVVQDVNAKWNYVNAPFGSGSINIQGASDPWSGNNFSESRSVTPGQTVAPYAPAPTTQGNFPSAAFNFSDVNGDWIGVADVSIAFNESILGTLTAGAQTTGPSSYVQTKITLTACGTYPVVN